MLDPGRSGWCRSLHFCTSSSKSGRSVLRYSSREISSGSRSMRVKSTIACLLTASGPNTFSMVSKIWSSRLLGRWTGTQSRKAWGPGADKAAQRENWRRTSSAGRSMHRQSGVSTTATCVEHKTVLEKAPSIQIWSNAALMDLCEYSQKKKKCYYGKEVFKYKV